MLLYTQNVYASKGARSYNAISQLPRFAKTAQMRARRERRGFADGNLLCVNEQGKTQA